MSYDDLLAVANKLTKNCTDENKIKTWHEAEKLCCENLRWMEMRVLSKETK